MDFLGQPRDQTRSKLLKIHLWKESAATVVTIGIILVTQCGIFNSCACYTHFGKTGVALPEIQPVKDILHFRIHYVYTSLAFSCIVAQIMVPFVIYLRYPDAIRVFAQRDDGESNLWAWARSLRQKRLLGRGQRTPTGLTEQGLRAQDEMQNRPAPRDSRPRLSLVWTAPTDLAFPRSITSPNKTVKEE